MILILTASAAILEKLENTSACIEYLDNEESDAC
jgi:hypothetical protein